MQSQISNLKLPICLLLLAGCATSPSSPPTALESKFFTIQTNWIPQVQTHIVTQTNFVDVPQIVQQTNTVTVTNTVTGQAIPQLNIVTLTNHVLQTVLETNTVTLTNPVPSYVLTPNQTAKDTQAAIGAAGSLFGPYGGLAAGLVGGIFGLWGKLRSSKSQAASETLAQVIETGSELMKTTPQGEALADKWKTWMIQHQSQEGVLEQVTSIVAKTVDNQTARQAANQLTALAQTVRNP